MSCAVIRRFSLLLAPPEFARFREEHIRWTLRCITASKSRIPHQVRLAACSAICKIAYPEEIVAGIQERIWQSGAIHPILRFARQGALTIHRKTTIDQVQFDHQIASGMCRSNASTTEAARVR
jgi:hypothetical protein